MGVEIWMSFRLVRSSTVRRFSVITLYFCWLNLDMVSSFWGQAVFLGQQFLGIGNLIYCSLGSSYRVAKRRFSVRVDSGFFRNRSWLSLRQGFRVRISVFTWSFSMSYFFRVRIRSVWVVRFSSLKKVEGNRLIRLCLLRFSIFRWVAWVQLVKKVMFAWFREQLVRFSVFSGVFRGLQGKWKIGQVRGVVSREFWGV